MNWATVIWPAAAGACLMLGGLHLAVWCRDRRAWASLVFAVTSAAVAVHAFIELQMMQARTPEAFGAWLRWSHPWSFLAIAGSVVFVRLYFGTGRLWLGALIIGIRLAALGLNFGSPVSLNYVEVTGLRLVPFLGGEAAVAGEAVINRWMWLAQSAFALWLLYVLDAAVTLWRRGTPGERRRALVVGGGMALFIVLGTGHAVLALNGVIRSPLVASLAFLLMTFAMGWELGRDVLRAAWLARELHASERRLSLAASAGRVALWEWRVERDGIWLSSEGRALHGVPPGQAPGFQHFASTLHPDDRPRVLDIVRQAVDGHGTFAVEYRIVLPDGAVRWIAGSGAAERDPGGGGTLLRGVSVDITGRRRAEDELHAQRGELAHLARVATLGELSGSLAHELNQPLAIILSNAQAAQRLLAQEPPDLAEVRDILADIVSEDRRAGEVIRRLRALLRRGEPERRPLALPEVIGEVLELMRSDFIARGVGVAWEPADKLPPVPGDRVPLQQVLLNLLTNACDAMAANPPGERRLTVSARREGAAVRVSVRDEGQGLPADAGRIFEPFFTTKPHGLGMGLPICRTIVTAHGGRLWAEANAGRGATFHLELPAPEAAA